MTSILHDLLFFGRLYVTHYCVVLWYYAWPAGLRLCWDISSFMETCSGGSPVLSEHGIWYIIIQLCFVQPAHINTYYWNQLFFSELLHEFCTLWSLAGNICHCFIFAYSNIHYILVVVSFSQQWHRHFLVFHSQFSLSFFTVGFNPCYVTECFLEIFLHSSLIYFWDIVYENMSHLLIQCPQYQVNGITPCVPQGIDLCSFELSKPFSPYSHLFYCHPWVSECLFAKMIVCCSPDCCSGGLSTFFLQNSILN